MSDRQHVAYEAARELDLMGVLQKPDTASLSETAPMETTVAYNLARFVPALLSLLVAILYLDAFTFKGLRLIVRRADPKTWRGFEQKPYIFYRMYGIALAAPYLVNVYMLARAAGLFGEAAKDARRGRTRVGLLYEKYLGYEGSHFVWKVFCFQIVEVFLQAFGKIPLFMTYMGGGDGAAFWFTYVFILALLVNVLYPTFLLRSRLVRYQRDVSFVADTFLDIVYAVTPFVFLIAGVRSCVEIKQWVGCTDNSSLSHFSAMTRPSWLGRAVSNRPRHAIEQASRRWRGVRRDDSARTRRKILISTQPCTAFGAT